VVSRGSVSSKILVVAAAVVAVLGGMVLEIDNLGCFGKHARKRS